MSTAATPQSRSPKRAHLVVREIERDLADAGWPVGEVLGSEAELIERYGVSRAVFREAVRVLEHLGVLRTRRGPGGGIVVNAPATDAMAGVVAKYLEFNDVSVQELVEARTILEALTVTRAVARLNSSRLAALRQALDRHVDDDADQQSDFHLAIAEATGNPVYSVFIGVLTRVTADFAPRPEDLEPAERERAAKEVHRAHGRIAEALLAGDVGTAHHRMQRHLQAAHEWIDDPANQDRRRGPSALDDTTDRRARQVAEAIVDQVARERLRPGDMIGSEPDLMQQYDVGRDVFREAVRVLEYYSLVETRRGPGGGLRVSRPDPRIASGSLALYLELLNLPPGELLDTRIEVEGRVVQLAAERANEQDISRLRERIDQERTVGVDGLLTSRNLHPLIAEVSGNRALQLFAGALSRAVIPHYRVHRRADARSMLATASDDHPTIVDAIADGDGALARMRMQEHLESHRRFLGEG